MPDEKRPDGQSNAEKEKDPEDEVPVRVSPNETDHTSTTPPEDTNHASTTSESKHGDGTSGIPSENNPAHAEAMALFDSINTQRIEIETQIKSFQEHPPEENAEEFLSQISQIQAVIGVIGVFPGAYCRK